MKIKFIDIGVGEMFLYKGNVVNVGDVIDVPKDRAEDLIARGKAEKITTKETNEKSE